MCGAYFLLAGTAGNPVTIRPAAGFTQWSRIVTYGNLSGASLSTITNAALQSAGSKVAAQNEGLAAIRVACVAANCSTPIITNSAITASSTTTASPSRMAPPPRSSLETRLAGASSPPFVFGQTTWGAPSVQATR